MAQVSHESVIREATNCAVVYDTSEQARRNSEPTISVVDMATTGGIPEGYTHLIFVAIDRSGYVVSRNLEAQYKVEIHGQVSR